MALGVVDREIRKPRLYMLAVATLLGGVILGLLLFVLLAGFILLLLGFRAAGLR